MSPNRNPARALVAVTVVLSGCAYAPAGVHPDFYTSEVPFLDNAHSHNDYWQSRPLLDALERGFASIEVDVALVDGELYVAHAADEIEEGTTLTSLYLDPLRAVVRQNGGTVYGTSRPPLQLLIDVKTDSLETHTVLHRTLEEYADVFTAWTDGEPRPGAVTAVLSGNRATARITAEPTRYLAIDGRLLEDREGLSPEAMPLVSEDWENLGPPVSEARLERARRIVADLHAEGRKVRFWATPEDEGLWRALIAVGVDYIGTDDVDRLQRFFRDERVSGSAGGL